jgi:hypothetical protein
MKQRLSRSCSHSLNRQLCAAMLLLATLAPGAALADEGGVSMWLPGAFGSLAAVPPTPGWSFAAIYYHTSVDAGAEVARERQIAIGRRTANVNLNLNAELDGDIHAVFVVPSYTAAEQIWGGFLTLGLMAGAARPRIDIDAAISGTIGGLPFGAERSLNDSRAGFADLYPRASMSWNQGVHNYMVYSMADIPVGTYDSSRLANVGIGHWAIDGGAGYTYFNPQTGHELSVVTGLTYNFKNPHTDYQNGVDIHIDWAASQFFTKQFHAGIVGYHYNQLSDDRTNTPLLQDIRSRVSAVGPQIGYLFPVGNMQGYLNLKAYFEFDAAHRPDGWNAWLTFSISPTAHHAAPPPSRSASARR